jgi:hypothetical protein
MKRRLASHSTWDLESLACSGALLGLLPVSVHQIHSLAIGDLHSDDPFLHLMLELVGAMLGGALLLCALGWILNRQAVKKERQG